MELKEKLQALLAKRNSISSLLEERKSRLAELENEVEVTSKSQIFVQTIAQEVQSKLSSKIDNIVNLGLATCFPSYSFEMKYVPSRGKTEVQFIFKEGEFVIDPMSQVGGGLVDVAAFLLRIAVYSISNVNNTLVFDEPGKFISAGLRQKFSEVLKILSERLNLQILEVTHVREFAENSDKKILIKKTNKISEVVENE